MRTIFDLVGLIIFFGVAILFLQECSRKNFELSSSWKFLIPALGCAIGNALGNNGQPIAGGLVFAAVMIFMLVVLRPVR